MVPDLVLSSLFDGFQYHNREISAANDESKREESSGANLMRANGFRVTFGLAVRARRFFMTEDNYLRLVPNRVEISDDCSLLKVLCPVLAAFPPRHSSSINCACRCVDN